MSIRLRSYEDDDLPQVMIWFAQEHVRQWFEPLSARLFEMQHRHDQYAYMRHRIILAQETPIGFCQHYAYWLSGEIWHGNIPPEGTYSIDYLIGETDYLHKGLGTETIRLLEAEIRDQPEAKRIIVQPETENHASCGALLSAGFQYNEENRLYLLEL